MDKSEILLQFCQEEWSQARQAEDQRATITNMILLIASGIIGFVAQKGLTRDVLALTVSLIGLGFYGAIAAYKMHERHEFHTERARAYRREIVEKNPILNLDKCRLDAIAVHVTKFSLSYKIRSHYIWLTLDVSIALLGLILTVLILV